MEQQATATVSECQLGTEREIATVLERSRSACSRVRNLSYSQRIAILKRVQALMGGTKEALITGMVEETAMPIRHAKELYEMSLRKVDYGYGYLQQLHTTCYPELQSDRVAFTLTEPHGVALAIFPAISPLYLAAEIFSACVITGNAIVFHSPAEVLGTFSKMARFFVDAGWPEDAIIALPPMEAEAVVEVAESDSIDVIVSMAGSYGRSLSEVAGRRLKTAWLSITGKNPILVFEDADIGKAARLTAWSGTFISGLVCTDTELVLVHKSVAAAFKEKLVGHMATLKVGDPRDEEVDVGPIMNQRILENASRQLEDAVAAGARILLGGKVDGNFFQPTVLDRVTGEMAIANQRTSAPIVPIIEFEGEEEAIKTANHNPYGLRAAVFSQDVQRIFRVVGALKVGGVMVNHPPFHHDTMYPDGGYKDSGLGTLRYLVEELRRKKLVVLHDIPMGGCA